MGLAVIDTLVKLPSVTKLKGQAQIDEIERRLSMLYEDCRKRDVTVTLIHIRTALGIDDNTFTRWLNTTVRHKGKEIALQDARSFDKEAQELIMARGVCLKKWLDRAEVSCMEAISANPKAGGPMFQAKAVFGYREQKDTSINMQISVEDFLKKVKPKKETPGKRPGNS